MAKLEVERASEKRDVRPASVASRGRGRPIADLIQEIEEEQPALVASREVSSAALRAGDLIRSMRKAAGFSQTVFAERLGVSQARVSELEAGMGRQGPTWDLMERVAATCGMRLGSVITGAATSAYVAKVVHTLVRMGLPDQYVHLVEFDGQSCVSLDLVSEDRGSAQENVVLAPSVVCSV